uniref:SUEL-type lectin domain-containing protein n=2 Tax=Cyprinus carpio TaxID=7962 RepID=A0A8C1THN0_CYPCA
MCFELVFFFFSQYWTVLYVNLSDLVFPYLVYCFYIKIFYELIVSALFNFSETVVTCDGFVQSLSCDTGVISVQSATYGRTSSQICSAGRPRSQISNTWCSKNVPVIFKRCNGLRTCEFKAQGLARPDPCFGTYKYYTTNYICITAETSVTCDRGYGYLKCEHGKIQINTANYGRTDKTTCSQGRPSQQLQNTNCFSPNALDFVSKSCNGLDTCKVYAKRTGLTDPCFGTYKYLAISYSCLHHKICEYLFATQFILLSSGSVFRILVNNNNSIMFFFNQVFVSLIYILLWCRCEGKSSCSILASNSVFSDPCFGTFKYLNISYSCVSKCKCYCIEKLYCIVFLCVD